MLSEIEITKQKAKVWGLWPTIGFGVVIFGIYFAATFLVTIAFLIFQSATNAELDILQFTEKLTSNGLLISLAVIISSIAGTAFVLLFVKFRKETSIAEYLGLRHLNKKTIVILVIVFIGLFLISMLIDVVFQRPQDAEFSIQAYQTSVWPPLLWIAVVIFAPLFEEFFFRGFLFVGIKESHLGTAGAVILTSLLWAGLHTQYSLYGMTTILILGIIFGIVRVLSGSLWSTLFLHALWNFAAMIATALAGR